MKLKIKNTLLLFENSYFLFSAHKKKKIDFTFSHPAITVIIVFSAITVSHLTKTHIIYMAREFQPAEVNIAPVEYPIQILQI